MYKEKRIHPICILNSFIDGAKHMFIPFVVLLISQSRAYGGLYFGGYLFYSTLGATIIFIGYNFLNWFFLKYSFSDGVLFIKSGIFVKKERFIKKERVQTVNVKAGVLFRIFDLVILDIETAGGDDEPEVTLPAINKRDAEFIREELKEKQEKKTTFVGEKKECKGETLKTGAENTEVIVPFRRIILSGIASGGVGIVFSVAGLFFSFGRDFIPDRILNNVIGFLTGLSIMRVIALVFIVFIISWMISVIAYIIKNGNFSLVKNGTEVKIVKGLIERKELSFKTTRIQGIKFIESPIRQLLGYGVLEFIIAGGADAVDEENTVVHPMVKKVEVEKLIKNITGVEYNLSSLESLPKRSFKRYILRSILPFAVFPVVNLLLILNTEISYFIWLNLLLLIPSVIFGYLRYKTGGFNLNKETLILRNRVFNARTLIINKRNIQDLTLRSNSFQRMKNLRTVKVTLLSAYSGFTFSLKDLDTDFGKKLWYWIKK